MQVGELNKTIADLQGRQEESVKQASAREDELNEANQELRQKVPELTCYNTHL